MQNLQTPLKQPALKRSLLALAIAASTAAYADDHANNAIEEVEVIASKTNETRQELSSSLGYFDAERLQNETIFNVEDVFDRTANAFTGTTGFGAYSIRGVNNIGIAGSINNSNALASIVVNQVALGVASGDYVKPSLFDAKSVEILRGPQTTVQGPNSLIGAVYVNYEKPSFDNPFEGKLRLEYGELETIRGSVAQNVVLADDVLAARLVLDKRLSDGDVVNTATGSDDVQRTDEETIRLALRAQPLGDESLVFDLTYTTVDSDSNPFGLVVSPPGGDLFDRLQPYNVDDQYPSEFEQLSLEAVWQINDNLTLTSVTGSNEIDVLQVFDGDLTPFPFLAVTSIIEEELFSQEFRLNYSADQFNVLVGLFYSDGDYTRGFSGVGIFPDGMGGVRPFNTTTRNKENIEQTAVFAKVDWDVSDTVSIEAGVRANREKRSNDNFANNNGLISDLQADESYDQIIPSLALSYNLTDHTAVGASYAKGVQSGGIAFAVFLGQSGSYEEEFTDNYELFLRHQSEDGNLVVNANLFLIDWKDQQVTATVPGGFPGFDDLVNNAGKSSVQGLEIELEWQASEQLEFFTSLGFTDSEFDEFVLNGVDLAGRAFPSSPEYNLAIGFDYQSDSGFFAAGTFSYVDKTYTEISAPAATEISERTLLSSRVGYQADNWRAYLWGQNLLDDEYEFGLFDGATFGLPGAYGRVGHPRTVGLGVEFKW